MDAAFLVRAGGIRVAAPALNERAHPVLRAEGKELFLEIVIVLKPVIIPAGIKNPVPDVHHVQKPPEFLFRQFKLHYDPLLSVNIH